MSHVFNINNMSNFNEKINIDELYEKKKNYDLSKLEIFNKLLNRVHTKIKLTSRQRLDVQYCWFAVPEIMIGVPKYDQGACISYIMDKLIDNGFNIVIYANHLLRASYPAMKYVAEKILMDSCSSGVDKDIISISEILNLIPGTK